MNQESIILVLLFFIIGTVSSLVNMMQKQRIHQRCLDIKLDALLKAQGVAWPTLSAEVQALALDSRKKIAAIKLHRDENPSLSIAEAKAEVEAFAATKR